MPLGDDHLQVQDEMVRGWVKEIHFYIFHDNSHDSFFVQHCFMLHWEHITSRNQVHPIRHWVWSNGCTVEFKLAKL
jgi:hypothetical protein